MKRVLVFALVLVLPSCGRKLPPKPPPGQEGVDRVVLAELFTATWCTFCPNATMAIDSLAAQFGSNQLAVLQYHPSTLGDPLGTAQTDGRIRDCFGAGANPPMILFDGRNRIEGAPSLSQTYANYRDRIESRLLYKSPVQIAPGIDSLHGDTVWVKASFQAVTDLASPNLIVHFAVTEDSISYSAPNGETLHRYVVRRMLPDENGQTVSVPGGGTWILYRSFVIDPAWDRDRLCLVVFAQDPSNREIHQAAAHRVSSPSFDFSLSALGDTLAQVPLNTEHTFFFRVENTGTEGDTLVFQLPERTLPQQWTAVVCAGGLCSPDSVKVGLAPGAAREDNDVAVTPVSVSGSGWVLLRATSRGDPSKSKTLRFTVSTPAPTVGGRPQ